MNKNESTNKLTTEEWRKYLKKYIESMPEYAKRSGPCYYAPTPETNHNDRVDKKKEDYDEGS